VAICDDCFEDFVHPLVHESQKKNDRFWDRYGDFARWDWDHDRSTLTFTDPAKSALEIDVSIVGTTEGDSWQWSWANANIPQQSKLDIQKVREFGEANSIEKLTSRFLSADKYTGWEMTSVAVHVLDAPGSYRIPTDNGYCYLIFRNIKEARQ